MFEINVPRRILAGVFAGTTFAFAGCGDSPSEGGGNEQEVITEVSLTLTPVAGGAAQTATITDPDGLGPDSPNPQEGTLVLTPGVAYNGSVTFTDATKTPPEDITEEVEEEAEEHRVFYTVSANQAAVVTIANLDTDDNGAPVGLTFVLTTADAATTGTGEINVVLSHFDEEPKGTGDAPSDETDANVTFDFSIE